MKKKLVFIIAFFIFPLFVYADSVELDCPSEVVSGSEFTCSLVGKTTGSVTSLEANVGVSSGITFISFANASNWQGSGEGGYITLYRENGVSGEFNIGTIKFKYNGNDSNVVNIYNVVFNYEDFNEKSVEAISNTIKIKKTGDKPSNNNSNDNVVNNKVDNNPNYSSQYLNELVIDGYDINFDKMTFEYTINVTNDNNLVIIPTLEDDNSTYLIKGNDNLINGSVVKIIVTSNDNVTSQEYIINIKKDNNTSSNNKKNYTLIFVSIIVLLITINVLRITIVRRKRNG